jgi:phytoene dehydrogenase-like protein
MDRAGAGHNAVVVGAGHNGLVAAATLARRGWRVTVFERRHVVGGAAVTEELIPGYRFSSGAYLAYLLHEQALEAAGCEPTEWQATPLGPPALCLPNGRVLRLGSTVAESAAIVEREFGTGEGGRYQEWERQWTLVAAVLDKHLVGPPPSLDDLRATAEQLGTKSLIDEFATCSAADLVRRAFATTEARTAFGRTVDGDPCEPGSALAAAYFQTSRFRRHPGLGVPRGAMGSVTGALAAAARRAGVDIHLGRSVRRILVDAGGVNGVELADGTHHPASVVLSNADPVTTVRELLGGAVETPTFEHAVRTSAVKLHCALAAPPDTSRIFGPGSDLPPGHVRMLTAWEWPDLIGQALRAGSIPRSAPLELQLPSLIDSTIAPPGHHIVSAYMSPVPPLLTTSSWPECRDDVRDWMLDRIEMAIPNIRTSLVDCVTLTPADLAERFGFSGGCIRHLSQLPAYSLERRPALGWADGSTPVPGLFLCGSGIHPGGEVSGLPGLNAARTVLGSGRG